MNQLNEMMTDVVEWFLFGLWKFWLPWRMFECLLPPCQVTAAKHGMTLQ